MTDKTKALRENKRRQLGELIVATGADALDIEVLAGGLLTMVGANDAVQTESWRRRGAAFFRKTARRSAGKSGNAVYHATGKRVRDLPIALDKLLR